MTFTKEFDEALSIDMTPLVDCIFESSCSCWCFVICRRPAAGTSDRSAHDGAEAEGEGRAGAADRA